MNAGEDTSATPRAAKTMRLFSYVRSSVFIPACFFLAAASDACCAQAAGAGDAASAGAGEGAGDGAVVKAVLKAADDAPNILRPDKWVAYELGFQREGEAFLCDNGSDAKVQRGASQTVELNQSQPEPIVASAWSKAEGVGGGPDSDYSLYLDLIYADGTPLWGQIAPFPVGTHDWQKAEVVIFPDKPVRQVAFHMLLRRHGGRAFFRGATLGVVRTRDGACLFDAVPVVLRAARPAARPAAGEGFHVRDVAAGSDFIRIDRSALGLRLDWQASRQGDATSFDATLTDTTGKDRAVTLLYTVAIPPEGLRWLGDPRRSEPVRGAREYMSASTFRVGANGRLSRWPLAAVADDKRGHALAIDMAHPAFFRVGYNAAAAELFIAYDIGLTPERPSARVRFCRFPFDPKWGFRSALARLYEVYGDHFRCRTPRQGLWMPFAKISQVKGWEDFGFRFKEGDNETKWDDQHEITTFRYTEPMTWWMPMPKDLPRTLEAAVAEARRLAAEKGDPRAKALFTSGYHNEAGQFPARLLDTPWCNGAVWSMNSAPGVTGEHADFGNKWNPALRERLYGPKRTADLDGEYVDSSECYVTDELNFRREHFAAAGTPLTFSRTSRRCGVFTGLAVFEYVRAIAADVHGAGKLMMANGTPLRLCWLAPLLEVMGTETDWNPGGKWRPMSDEDLLYRRALCRAKPYCFLMNTPFERFSHELVERYMKRCLAYGTFPGFFSHNASQGHYFTRPELYDRDRSLFRRYVPLCRLVAEAGWEPVTLATSDDPKVYVERFGRRYLTIFNDSPQRRTATVRLEGLAAPPAGASRELLSGKSVGWRDGKAGITLDGEDVAVIDLEPGPTSAPAGG